MITHNHAETRCSPLELVLSRLPDATEVGGEWSVCCPAHEDGRASLSITQGTDGRVLLHCFAGCPVDAICDAVDLQVTDLFARASTLATATHPPQSLEKLGLCRQSPAKPKGQTYATSDEAVAAMVRSHGPLSMSWTYTNADGEPVGIILRWNLPNGKKDIRPVAKHADGWRLGGMSDPRPLYRLPTLADAGVVFICEGEKACEAVRSIGLTATTSAHGSQSASKSDWTPLAGKRVVILPDNDDPGQKYAAQLTTILMTLNPPAVVQVVDLPGLPKGGDMVEWLAAQPDPDDHDAVCDAMLSLIEAAEPITADVPAPAPPLIDRFEPFPVDALPEPLRSFVAAGAKAIGCDPSFIALPNLTVCGSAIGNTARLQIKVGWQVPPILWTAVIGESGTAKTPAFRLVMKPVRERQYAALQRHAEADVEHQAATAFYKRSMKQWETQKNSSDAPPRMPDAPHAERVYTEDATIEAIGALLAGNPRGMLLARDELSGWLASFDQYSGGKGGADSAKWLSMFNAETVTIDRKTGTPKLICVPNAAMSITGGIQPAILKRALGSEHRESGMAARFLMAYPPRSTKRWTEAEIDPEQDARYAEVLNRLYDLPFDADAEGRQCPHVVRLSPEAKARFVEFYEANSRELSEFTGDLAAAWSKLEEAPGRLALVIHFVRWAANDPTLKDQGIVDGASMESAIRLTNWFKGEA